MIVVAVAGGTSLGLGRSIVTALKEHSDHTPIVLSRSSSSPPKWLSDLGVELRTVDYASVDSLKTALSGVHTVISVVLPRDGTWASSQINLLNAAVDAGASRFAPSEFAVGPIATTKIPMLAPKTEVWKACEDTVKRLKDEGRRFEWTRFMNGMFMNYLGYGCEKEEEALAGKEDDGETIWFQKDGNLRAEIPVESKADVQSGKIATPMVTITEIGDIGRFVAAACSLPGGKWEVDMGMSGSTMRIGDVVKVIEDVRGRKMEIKYMDREELESTRREKETANDFMSVFWTDLALMNARDSEGEGFVKARLNELCPDVKPITVEGFMRKYWG